ncbi:MAG: hypothetical protein JWN86_3139 [Planctomycetota bacterium]|nr:hypothetical protein [Planctomycetota bacterium]
MSPPGVGTFKFEVPADFDAFYKSFPDVSEAQVALDIAELRGRKDWVGIEKAWTAYLKHHNKHAAPWMYAELATAMEINKRDPAIIKTTFGWYAYMASKSKDPRGIALIAACDALLLHKYYEIALPNGIKVRLADLLDQAVKVAPQNAEPILMSILMAERLKDIKRFLNSSETLLSLGWPGVDETWRTGLRNRFSLLAKQLREEGRDDDAKELTQRLSGIEARDLVVRLTWEKDSLLELCVDEPLGATADHYNPRTVFGGALVKEGRGKDREAVYVCPRGFDGTYVIRVNVLYNDENQPTKVAKLEIVSHEGTPDEQSVYQTLSLSKLEPIRINLSGGRRKTVLPYFAPNQLKAPTDEPLPPRHDPGKSKAPAVKPATGAGAKPKP